MQNLHYGLIMLMMLLSPVIPEKAQASIGIGLPTVSIGINLPMYPQLVRVPGYPVYYASRLDANYFFYDGMYWVYQADDWYASSWYNGPWGIVDREYVPLFILRVPVRYYRDPPEYFRGWQANAPPRWGQHWGNEWQQHRSGWDKWNRSSAPAPAPLPVYQKKFSGERYPHVEQQQTLRSTNYRYQPRDTVVRDHLKPQVEQKAPPAARGRQEVPATRNQKQLETPHPAPLQQGAPPGMHTQPPQRGGEQVKKSPPVQAPPQQRAPAVHEQKQQPAPAQHEQQTPRVREQQQNQQQERRESQEPNRVRGQEPNRDRGQEPNRDRGQGQNKDDDRGRGR